MCVFYNKLFALPQRDLELYIDLSATHHRSIPPPLFAPSLLPSLSPFLPPLPPYRMTAVKGWIFASYRSRAEVALPSSSSTSIVPWISGSDRENPNLRSRRFSARRSFEFRGNDSRAIVDCQEDPDIKRPSSSSSSFLVLPIFSIPSPTTRSLRRAPTCSLLRGPWLLSRLYEHVGRRRSRHLPRRYTGIKRVVAAVVGRGSEQPCRRSNAPAA